MGINCVLHFGEFSKVSDVWAFRVRAWENFPHGETPYERMRIDENFNEYLREGNRLLQPTHASKAMYAYLVVHVLSRRMTARSKVIIPDSHSCWEWNSSVYSITTAGLVCSQTPSLVVFILL